MLWPLGAVLHDLALDTAQAGADVRVTAAWDAVGPYTLALSALFRTGFVVAVTGYPTRLVPFVLGWVADGLPTPVLRRIVSQTGPGYAVRLRLVRPWYARSERRTFGYA